MDNNKPVLDCCFRLQACGPMKGTMDQRKWQYVVTCCKYRQSWRPTHVMQLADSTRGAPNHLVEERCARDGGLVPVEAPWSMVLCFCVVACCHYTTVTMDKTVPVTLLIEFVFFSVSKPSYGGISDSEISLKTTNLDIQRRQPPGLNRWISNLGSLST